MRDDEPHQPCDSSCPINPNRNDDAMNIDILLNPRTEHVSINATTDVNIRSYVFRTFPKNADYTVILDLLINRVTVITDNRVLIETDMPTITQSNRTSMERAYRV